MTGVIPATSTHQISSISMKVTPVKRARFSDVLSYSPSNSPIAKTPTKPILKHSVLQSQSKGCQSPLDSTLDILSRVYTSSIDPPSLEMILKAVFAQLNTSSSNTNILVVYGAFYMTLRGIKRLSESESAEISTHGSQLLKYSKRDLISAEKESETSTTLAYKKISVIVRVVDFLVSIKEVVDCVDRDLLLWFYGKAVQFLGNPSTPKVCIFTSSLM